MTAARTRTDIAVAVTVVAAVAAAVGSRRCSRSVLIFIRRRSRLMFHLFPIFLRFRVPRRRGRVRKDDREWEPAPLLLLVQRTAVERHRRRRGLRSLFLRRVRCEEEGVERVRG